MGCIVEYKNQIISNCEIKLSSNNVLLNSSNFNDKDTINYKINVIKCKCIDNDSESKGQISSKNKIKPSHINTQRPTQTKHKTQTELLI